MRKKYKHQLVLNMDILTFEDIPYHTIVEFIAIHLDMRDFGVLSMVSTYLNEIFMSNDVWKRLYIQSNRSKFKITDKSIHVGPCLSSHKDRIPVGEIPASNLELWYHGSHWLPPYLSPWSFRRSMLGSRCVPISATNQISEDAYRRVVESLPAIDTPEVKKAYQNARNHLCAAVIDFNKRSGHEHSHLCTNIDHYLLDTLDAPSSVRNYRDFRKQTLSKFLTQTKHDPDTKKAAARARRKVKLLEKHQAYIRQLKKEINSDYATIRSNEKLSKSLSIAIGK